MNVRVPLRNMLRYLRDVCESQMASMEAASAAEAPAPAPVVSFEAFRSLCNTPPLQVCILRIWECTLPCSTLFTVES